MCLEVVKVGGKPFVRRNFTNGNAMPSQTTDFRPMAEPYRYRSRVFECERDRRVIEARLLYDRMVFRDMGGESPPARIGRSIAKTPTPSETIVAQMTWFVFNATMRRSAEIRKEK